MIFILGEIPGDAKDTLIQNNFDDTLHMENGEICINEYS
jgi:hypothetical protein